MGSWNETCSLTNVGIREDDQAVRVRFAIPKYGDYRLRRADFGLELNDFRYIVDITEGKYDDYGRLAGPSDEATQEADRRYVLGLMNGPDEAGTTYAQAWFLKEAWEWAIQLEPLVREGWESPPLERVQMWLEDRGSFSRLDIEQAALDRMPDGPDKDARAAKITQWRREQVECEQRLTPWCAVTRVLRLARKPLLLESLGPQLASDSYDVQQFLMTVAGRIVAKRVFDDMMEVTNGVD